MSGNLPTSYIFNETQTIPTHNLSSNVDILNKLVEMSNKPVSNNNDEDIKHIKMQLTALETQYNKFTSNNEDVQCMKTHLTT